MEDEEIIRLYFSRSEHAIRETDQKYGSYCYTISHNILGSPQDAEETVSDTYLEAWNTMPPQHPTMLSSFLGRITRHLSIDRWRASCALKRGGGEVTVAMEELEGCVSDGATPEAMCENKELQNAIREFLLTLPKQERQVFLCRYFYLDSIATIAGYTGFSVSKVTSMLHRTRGKLRDYLAKEGYV